MKHSGLLLLQNVLQKVLDCCKCKRSSAVAKGPRLLQKVPFKHEVPRDTVAKGPISVAKGPERLEAAKHVISS